LITFTYTWIVNVKRWCCARRAGNAWWRHYG